MVGKWQVYHGTASDKQQDDVNALLGEVFLSLHHRKHFSVLCVLSSRRVSHAWADGIASVLLTDSIWPEACI